MDEVISLREVSKIYRREEGEVHALDHVSLAVRRGEFLAVVGSSGSGKTTLMNLMGCLDAPTQGVCRFEGEDVPGISMYTFQDRVPVWIFGGRLQIDFGEISKRLHFC